MKTYSKTISYNGKSACITVEKEASRYKIRVSDEGLPRYTTRDANEVMTLINETIEDVINQWKAEEDEIQLTTDLLENGFEEHQKLAGDEASLPDMPF